MNIKSIVFGLATVVALSTIAIASELQPSSALHLTQGSSEDRAVKLAISADRKHTEGDYDGALADYNQAIALNPKDSEQYRNRGQLKHFRFNDSKGALADYNQAISLAPNDSPSYYLRGKLKLEISKDRAGAISDLTKAATIAKKDNLNRVVLEAELALKDANRQITRASRQPGAAAKAKPYVESGANKTQTGKYQEALEDLNRASEIDPQDGNIYAWRAIAKQNLNDISGAAIDYDRAIKLMPNEAYIINSCQHCFNRQSDRSGCLVISTLFASLSRSKLSRKRGS
jgi:tetratricopeptide (TPR) repeat protein